MEKSDIVSDVEVEKSRLGAEYIEDNVVEQVEKCGYVICNVWGEGFLRVFLV